MQQASSRALENPAIANYRFRALKVSPGYKHHGIVTKTQCNDGCDGRQARPER
jgi:hypothetical protein